ncbi:MAG: glutaredoxin [Gaiellaceae bacterium]
MVLGKQPPKRIRLYTSSWCAYCRRAKALLDRHGFEYEEIEIDGDDRCCRLKELTGGTTVPQVIIDGEPIGGYEELLGLVRSGALVPRRDLPIAPTEIADAAL